MGAVDPLWWLQQGLLIWLVALAALLVFRVLLDRDQVLGLLSTDADGRIDPERVQLAVVFPMALGGYVMEVAKALGRLEPGEFLTQMPDAPSSAVTILAVSQAVYLAGKINRSVKP